MTAGKLVCTGGFFRIEQWFQHDSQALTSRYNKETVIRNRDFLNFLNFHISYAIVLISYRNNRNDINQLKDINCHI